MVIEKNHGMKNCMLILLSCLAWGVGNAQQPTIAADPEQNLRTLGNLTPYSAGALGFDNRYEGIEGTPLLFDNWRTGSILFVKQDTFGAPLKINVDLITQVIMVQLQNGSIGEISGAYVQAIKVVEPGRSQSRKYIVAREGDIEGMRSVRPKFYEALHQGEFTFLKSVQKKFEKANYTGAYSPDKRSDSFRTDIVYWLQTLGNKPEKVALKRKDIEKVMPNYLEAIKRIAKEQKLGFAREEDIVQLLEFLEASER